MSTARLPFHVALVAEEGLIQEGELAQVAAVLQKQATRDFQPIWGVQSVVAAFPANAVPPHYSPVLIKRDLNEPGALGYHTTTHGQPISYVQYDQNWPLTCSHELLEMLADPFGYRKWLAASPDGSGEKVKILIEVCDPVEDDRFAYDIDGVKVSDFALPSWYHTAHRFDGRYSFTGAAQKPRTLREGGYVSWEKLDGSWWQQTFFGSGPSTRKLGKLEEFARDDESLREAIDRVTREFRAEAV